MNIYDKGTGVALVSKKNEVLLGLRSDGQGWGLAGGKIENNEMPFEAAMRECAEEFGYVVENPDNLKFVGRFFAPAIIKGEKQMVRSYIFMYKIPTMDIKLGERTTEMTELKWFSREEIMSEANLFPPTLVALNQVLKMLDSTIEGDN